MEFPLVELSINHTEVFLYPSWILWAFTKVSLSQGLSQANMTSGSLQGLK